MPEFNDFTPGAARAVGIVFSLPEEVRPFLRLGRFSAEDSRPRVYCGTLPGCAKPLRIVVSGVGSEKAAKAVECLVTGGLLEHVVICGYAGGLAASFGAGALILADSVLSESGIALSASRPLLHLASHVPYAAVKPQTGTLLTSRRVLVTANEKRAARARTCADAVDMESAGAAGAAERHGLPWIAVRAMTDGPDDDMPLDFNLLADAEGTVTPERVLRSTAAQPWKIPALIRLGVRSATAATHLAQFLAAYLQGLPLAVPD